MDYLDPELKKRHTRQLFIGYGLMAVMIGLGTIILVLLAYGYTFDRSTRTVIQNGLLFVDTNPVTANVYLNGELRGRGSQRFVLPAGEYTIEIEEEGYLDWRKTFNLSGGSVERFAYPFLFPETANRATYRTFTEEPSFTSVSPDRRWLLLHETEQIDSFVLYDLRRQVNLPTFFTLPAGVFSMQPDSELEVVEWSNNNRHVIVKHQFGDNSEHILVDREVPSESQNLSDRFADTSFTDISLIDKRFDSYHLFNRPTGELLQASLTEDDTTLLLEDVVTYRSHGTDVLLYVSSAQDEVLLDDQADEVVFSVMLYDDEETYRLSTAPQGEIGDYLLDIARLSGSWYVVVGDIAEQRAIIYENPISAIRQDKQPLPKFTLRTNDTPQRVSFSENARNIMMQGGRYLAVYDLERERGYQFEFGDDSAPRAYWMDGHRLLASWDDALQVVDFDGENRQTVTTCYDGYRPIFDTAFEYVYCLAPLAEGVDASGQFGRLLRSSLRAEDS